MSLAAKFQPPEAVSHTSLRAGMSAGKFSPHNNKTPLKLPEDVFEKTELRKNPPTS